MAKIKRKVPKTRKLTDSEQASLKYMKNKIVRNEYMKKSHLTPGTMLFYTYNPKDQKSPYDRTPLILVIAKSSKHVLGINFHWAPIEMRKKILKIFMNANKTNIKNKKPLELSKAMSKEMYRLCRPIFRKYIIKRMSKKCAVIPHTEMGYVINLRAEHFIGISSEEAFKLAYIKLKRR